MSNERHEKLAGLVCSQIDEVVQAEENALKALDQGIFFMPELALSYLVGKGVAAAIKHDPSFSGVTWAREMCMQGSGPCDFVLVEPQGSVICIAEFKMRQNDDEYFADVQKLATFDKSSVRVFCALVDAWSGQRECDPRIERLTNRCGKAGIPLDRIGEWRVFETIQDRYAGAISCVVATWRVG